MSSLALTEATWFGSTGSTGRGQAVGRVREGDLKLGDKGWGGIEKETEGGDWR